MDGFFVWVRSSPPVVRNPDFSIFFIIKVISADGRTKFIDSISSLALRV